MVEEVVEIEEYYYEYYGEEEEGEEEVEPDDYESEMKVDEAGVEDFERK
jgi:hypothetical protein